MSNFNAEGAREFHDRTMTTEPIADRLLMPNDPDQARTYREYIVCYATPVIAEDISAGISEWDPDARVHLCSAPEEALDLLRRRPQVHALISAEPPAELASSGLLRTLGGKGGRLVWLATREDIDTAEVDTSVIALDVPFTTATLHAALSKLGDG